MNKDALPAKVRAALHAGKMVYVLSGSYEQSLLVAQQYSLPLDRICFIYNLTYLHGVNDIVVLKFGTPEMRRDYSDIMQQLGNINATILDIT
ncbi:MAG: hypothetical protein M9928_15645 [Anaerolineae bacterium]|nr:hypothetical protein [Anaerolineae bacterium]MCO5194553.1 hypothetical protein [Anaerolineae bacterium]MCO5206470.1 hypothetical protein [Anaerolineae bacterium]